MVYGLVCKEDLTLARFDRSVQGWNSILDKLLICRSTAEGQALIERLARWDGVCILTFVNAHALNLAWDEHEYQQLLADADVLLRDGVGASLLMRLTGREPGLNMNGTDFIPELLKGLPRDRKVAVYGTAEPYLEKMVSHLKAMGFAQIDAEDGFHQDEYYVAQYLKCRPAVLLLAMGMPKQERVSSLLRSVARDDSVLIINGGAIVDFVANRFPRAPVWVRKSGLEWLFRFIQEPRRLWRRNLGYVVFVLRALLVHFSVR